MAQHSGNLSALISFDVIESEDCSIARRQLRDRFLDRDAIHNPHSSGILGSPDNLKRHFPVVSQLLKTSFILLEMHEYVVARHA